VALAWILHLAPNTLLIPGTSKRIHLRENLSVGQIALDDIAMKALDRLSANVRD
jgi:aryl-alcohol dehydrogenase-like predicted oxidoreductase